MEKCKASRIERIIKYLYSIAIILPLSVTLTTAYLFSEEYKRKNLKEIERQYYEKVEITSNLLVDFERLQHICASDETNGYFDSFIVTFVEEIDRQFGIYGRVLDRDGRLISTPYASPDEGELAILLEAEDFDFERELGFVRDAASGEAHITSRNDVQVHLHWMRYPVTEEYYYYILIGIVYDRIMVSIDMNTLTYGVSAIILSLIVSVFIIAYLTRMLYVTKEKCKNCDYKKAANKKQ